MSRTKWVGCVLIACAATGVAVAGVADLARADGKQAAVRAKAASPSRNVHILVFNEASLATYRGEIKGLRAPTQRVTAQGKQRLDSKGVASVRYVEHLKQQQAAKMASIESALGRAVNVRTSMQHAINAVVAEVSAAEAKKIAAMPGVKFVEAYREYAMDTDAGPELIGAPAVWDGTSGVAAAQGEGVVVGIIDSGINYGSPSFTATTVDGYTHVNPLGAGTFLGTCDTGGVNEGDCNAKLIGGYDFVCGPPASQCGVADIRDEPGFGDTDSHGSHTASTTAGNSRPVTFRGVQTQISGVAPRANIVAYDTCYHKISTGQGLCPNVSTLAAVNQAVEDGVVDVLNYSIGGGASPWADPVSMAFLGAVESGIYVAASAGNSGPGPNTLGHLEPWVGTTAAAQHTRSDFAFLMQVTGPTPVPPALTAVIVNPGAGGIEFAASLPSNTTLTLSPTYGNTVAGDLCNPVAAGSFAGDLVIASRGVCSFTIKTNNAAAAGAVGILIANNTTGGIIPSVPDTTIPAFGITQADGNALRDFVTANPTATGFVGFPAATIPSTPDVLASFSSRGPAATLEMIKPDITGPGVNILAVTAGTTETGFEQSIGLISGTSMSSPHHAGAAALVHQARPSWTPSEIKSALMMTSERAVIDSDGVTPATPFGKGAGRLQVDAAVNAGLLLDETADNYEAANPAAGGDLKTLNLASMTSRSCATTCTFTRTFRNPLSTSPVWTARLTGVTGTVSPRLIKVAPGSTVQVTVTVNGGSLPAGWSFGELHLEPARARRPANVGTLHLPIAISKP